MEIKKILQNKAPQVAMKHLMSDEVMDLIHKNMKPRDTIMAYYRCAIMEVETKFKVLNEQFSLEYDRNPIESIKSRTKSMESLAKKIRDKNIPLSIGAIEENINDIAGVRVICSFCEDIYMLADCLLKQDDITLIEMKDYIKNPKPNGYRSLHLIISVPIFLKDEKRDMKVKYSFEQLPWIFGQVWSIKSDIRKIFQMTCKESWQRNYCTAQIKVRNWI